MPKSQSVDEYVAGAAPNHRPLLETMRATIKAAAPQADETIAYDMPAFRLGGRFFLSYSAFKRHISLFPASGAVMAELGAQLAPYFRPKATLRFPDDAPIPVELVTRLVKVRLKELGSD